MKTLIIILVTVASVLSYYNTDRAVDITAGLIYAGIATWGWVEVHNNKERGDKRVYVNVTAVVFTLSSGIRFLRAAIN